MTEYKKKTRMPVSAETLFNWHKHPGAINRLLPPWERITLLRNDGSLERGSEVHFKTKKGPLTINWIARHTEYNPPSEFVEIQIKGPFTSWIHRHRMLQVDAFQSELEDHITFLTPGRLGNSFVMHELERIFRYRHQILQQDLQIQKNFRTKPLTVAIAGSSGMIGSALSAFLQTAGHRVIPILRRSAAPGEVRWNPSKKTIDQAGLEGIDAVVNLAGENIGSGRWSATKKIKIRDSRVQGTRLLVNTLNRLKNPPKVFISASAIGYYGSDMPLNCSEFDAPGKDFLASVCVEWEHEATLYTEGRCVIPRLGVVLSSSGGALSKMLIPFLLGIGGVINNGKQYLSWIALDDVVYALYRFITDDKFSGPVNLCSTKPATNYTFTKTLGKILKRPTILPLPAFAARFAFGEMADATLLSNSRVIPEILQKHQHKFYFADLEKYLRHTLGRFIQT